MKLVQKNNAELMRLCRKYNVKSLSVFGSAAKGKLSRESDIDFFVEFNDRDPVAYADNYFNLKFKLQDLFNRPIDLIEQRALLNPIVLQAIKDTQIPLYGS